MSWFGLVLIDIAAVVLVFVALVVVVVMVFVVEQQESVRVACPGISNEDVIVIKVTDWFETTDGLCLRRASVTTICMRLQTYT